MSKVEEYRKRIMEETGLTLKEIEEKMETQRENYKGLISDEGILFVICKELGVKVKDQTPIETSVYIVDVVNNKLKNLTVVGRIKRIYESRIFERKDGSTGKVMNFLIFDKTEWIRVTVWDDWVDKLIENEQFQVNNLIKLVNTYTKWSDYNNAYEIQVSKWSKIIINPEILNEDEYPEVEDDYEGF